MDKAATALKKLRREIGNIDAKIVALIAKRLALAKRIGKAKKQLGLPVYQAQREKKVVARVLAASKKAKVDLKFAKSLFKQIIAASRSVQK